MLMQVILLAIIAPATVMTMNAIYRVKAVELLAQARQGHQEGKKVNHLITAIRFLLGNRGFKPKWIGTTEEELAQLEQS